MHNPKCPFNEDGHAATHECTNGHKFNLSHERLDVTTYLTGRRCLFQHDGDPDYDDGQCDGKLTELDCCCAELRQAEYEYFHGI